MMLNSSHLNNTSIMAFKKVPHDNLVQEALLPRAQTKELLKSDPKLFWISFEEKDDSTLSFTSQESNISLPNIIHLKTKFHG